MAKSYTAVLSNIDFKAEEGTLVRFQRYDDECKVLLSEKPIEYVVRPGLSLNKQLLEINKALLDNNCFELSRADGEKLKAYLSVAYSKVAIEKFNESNERLTEIMKW